CALVVCCTGSRLISFVLRFVRLCRLGWGFCVGCDRHDVGRAIWLGLEFLIAGDLIRTVVVAPTMQNVAVLGLIVLIRTFLSLSLQLEIEGKLPWQRAPSQIAQD